VTATVRSRRTPDSIVDDEFGLVRHVTEVPREPDDPDIFNYGVELADTSEYLPLICFSNNGGAGITREAAYRAALGEAVERYCGSAMFPDTLTLGSYAEVSRSQRALAPGEIALFHPSQREAIHYPWFTEATRLCWTQGTSLTRAEPVLIPASLVFIPYYAFFREQGEEAIAMGISTGQASGHSYDAALLSGLYEIVERDAVSILWLNRLPAPRIDMASAPALESLYRERFARPNVEYALFDMTTDVRIPSVLCVLVDRSTMPALVCTGGASHANAERAALKALVEAAQTRAWAKFLGKRDEAFIVASDYGNIDDFEKHVFLYAYGGRLSALSFLLESRRTVPFSALPSRSYAGTAAELRGVRAEIEAKGYEVLAVDLTTDDVAECGYRAVKAMVPQMQHLEGDHRHRFLGCPRIYDVPPLLGYAAKRDPDELNADPHPYP
jgi:ribosomal protein S12 methylthiotransferase accessory factor